MYGLTEEDLRIRDTAREFVETLMPHEVEAELAGGLLPKEMTAEHPAGDRAGPVRHEHAHVGRGPGCTALQQVLVQEQCGRVTNGLAWVMATPPQWWPEVATDYQRERWLLPSVRGEKHEAYAITEEFAGSDVSALQTTARRDGDDYVINGVKWHVTSFNLADYVFVEAVLPTGSTRATTCCWWSMCRGPGWKSFAHRTIRTTSPTSTRSSRSTMCVFPPLTWSAPRVNR